MAALLELPVLPVLEVPPEALPVLALLLLEVHWNLPWMLPFPVGSGAFSFRVVQSSEMSVVEVTVKVPTTSLRSGISTLKFLSIREDCEMSESKDIGYLRGEVTTAVDSTTNVSQNGEGQVLESGVVDDGETTTNVLEDGQVQGGHIGIVDERNITSLGLGEVGQRQLGEVVGVEASRAVDDLQSGCCEGGGVGNGELLSPGERGQADGQVLTVGLEDQVVGQAGKGQVDGLETAVVVQVEQANGLERVAETSEGAQVGVADGDVGSSLDTSSEGQLAQSREGGPGDGAHGGEGSQAQGGESGKVVEGEGVRDGLQRASGQRDQGQAVSSQASLNLGNRSQVDSSSSV